MCYIASSRNLSQIIQNCSKIDSFSQVVNKSSLHKCTHKLMGSNSAQVLTTIYQKKPFFTQQIHYSLKLQYAHTSMHVILVLPVRQCILYLYVLILTLYALAICFRLKIIYYFHNLSNLFTELISINMLTASC